MCIRDRLKPDYLAAIDSRGFLLGSALALSSKIPLILIRKKGKLPPPVIFQKYSLEYGEDYLELSSQINLYGKMVRLKAGMNQTYISYLIPFIMVLVSLRE